MRWALPPDKKTPILTAIGKRAGRRDGEKNIREDLLTTVAETIRRKLGERFAPSELVIDDESGRHAGHAGARPGGETHFRVRVVSSAFEGLGRVARQRAVYDALSVELQDRVHALSVTTLTPSEAAKEA